MVNSTSASHKSELTQNKTNEKKKQNGYTKSNKTDKNSKLLYVIPS